MQFTTLVLAALLSSEDRRPRVELVSGQAQERYAKLLPSTSNPAFEAKKSALCWYDEKAMPPAYQHAGGVHDPRYNISAVPSEPLGNANREFPWLVTAGLEESGGGSHKFVYFPPGFRINIYRENKGGSLVGDGVAWAWKYPIGTIFGEVLTLRDQKGREYAFEMRTRERLARYWKVNVYRPCRNPDELATMLDGMAAQGTDKVLVAKCRKHLGRRRREHEMQVYADRNHPDRQVVSRRAFEDSLPPLPVGVVKRLLGSTFRPVESPWLETADAACAAPTTDESFHIVPSGYNGSFLTVSNHACMACHETAGHHADEFHGNRGSGTPGNRDWYGRVRGDDGIFSFHPFAASCISGNGFAVPVRWNQALVEAGLLRIED